MKELFEVLPQKGRIDWIGLRLEKRGKIDSVAKAEIDLDLGLVGDHYQGKSAKRQVTLIQAEHIDSVSAILQKDIDPVLLRRNIVVSGINLVALKDKQFQIGDYVILEYTGPCHPCSRMETNLGPGGYNTMRGHGGITARVIQGGTIHLGDQVVYHKQKK
jgi:MOSC domain-containing protein YiiM